VAISSSDRREGFEAGERREGDSGASEGNIGVCASRGIDEMVKKDKKIVEQSMVST
jgi:hypothetical protein